MKLYQLWGLKKSVFNDAWELLATFDSEAEAWGKRRRYPRNVYQSFKVIPVQGERHHGP
jgi:hypothetical protein